MKANELRIGNYCLVSSLVTKVSPSIITDVWECERPWLEPIPLTDEWLNKFGFINGGYDFIFWHLNDFELAGNDFLNQGEETPEYAYNWYLDDNKHNQILINYVHQLQNLYFALTNEELTITQ